MNTIIKYFSIYIFLFVLSLTSRAQVFNKADSLFNKAKYIEASIEYARSSFYSNNIDIKQEASYRRALCYRYMGKSDKALSELQRINIYSSTSDFRIKVIYESVLNSFIIEDFKAVVLYVSKLRFYEKDTLKCNIVIPMYILSLNALRDWDTAFNEFMSYIDISTLGPEVKDAYKLNVSNLYSKKNIPKEYSEDTAANWSRFIPGAGHMYSGHIAEGLFALSLSASFALSGAYLIYYHYYFTGYFLGIGLLHKSYVGGIKRSSNLALKNNTKNINLFNKKCVQLFININTHIE